MVAGRKFEFPVERAVFLSVLHRLFTSGSDRAAEKWKETVDVKDVDGSSIGCEADLPSGKFVSWPTGA